MLVFEFKAYGKAVQFQAIDEAIRTTQLFGIKRLDCGWKVLLNLGLNSRGIVTLLAKEFPFGR
ncbi:hypothetical protein [Nostoc sp. 'Peltigera malacea cyanobiont' DB3992]|uniref:hypothetical protein n=1 Tax=Nostoc sp. 'Peltigera malacea cyanobiont' DB3992 TaxID=1206980 RepID=UPI000C0536BD|nr:hypothetical protein [Nostoc sp. 'Peltigera malacea cyanobiont' DB3992]PHM09086.1 hypothetical protein CK516_16835 [Nostoc sp. 'Peltigera malacea cyanobiont' DB3992]